MKSKQAASILLLAVTSFLTQACNDMKKADIILVNGKVVTVDSTFSIREAVAVAGNRILAAGTSDEIKALAGSHTVIIDLKGKTLVPGLIDSHLHPETAALSELDGKLPDIHTIADLLGWIRQEVKEKGEGKWIILPKFFPTRLLEMRQPTLRELDEAAPSNPVFLNGSFGGMINSRALQVSGISDTSSSQGILKDPVTHKPTGFIRSSAFPLLGLPPERKLSLQEQEEALTGMLKRYNRCGITSLFVGSGDTASLSFYRSLERKKLLTARICQNILLETAHPVTAASAEKSISGLRTVTGDGDEWVRTGSLKVFLDGGILTGTAYMREPWGLKTAELFGIKDPGFRGVVSFKREELLEIVAAANRHGWNFTAHVTGEAAADLLLDVYSEVNREKEIRDRRFSIIHGNFFSPSIIRSMSELKVLAILQTAWFWKDAEAMDHILGKEKTAIFHPYRELIKGGVMINGGSDHMVMWDPSTSINPYDPFLAIYSMVTRRTERGSVFFPDQALTRSEALKAYTINNAYATFEEKIKGSIEAGKLADMALLSNDLLTCPEDSIRTTRVLMTMLDGKIIYTDPVWK